MWVGACGHGVIRSGNQQSGLHGEGVKHFAEG